MITVLLWLMLCGLLLYSLNKAVDAGIVLKLWVFFVAFYSIAPLFYFSGFQFFLEKIDYAPSADVLFIYLLTDLVLLLPVLLPSLCRQDLPAAPVLVDGFKGLWFLSVCAMFVDVCFNYSYFMLPKHEYISSIPYQTKNLYLFTIPYKEILVGFWFWSPFSQGRLKSFVKPFAVLALMLSFVVVVRHVLFIFILLMLLPRARIAGLIVLLSVFTLMGEVSNILKFVVEYFLKDGGSAGDLSWILSSGDSFIGMSSEQKAILSNLLVMMKADGGVEWLRMLTDFLNVPGVSTIAQTLGFELKTGAQVIGQYVGVEVGQGTAYSIQLVMLENLLLPIIPILLALRFMTLIATTPLIILCGEIVYSVMRNGADYWLYLIAKLALIYLLIAFVSFILSGIKQNVVPEA